MDDHESGADELAELVECVTPRQRAWITTAAEVIAIDGVADVERFADTSVDSATGWLLFDKLPEVTWSFDHRWRQRFTHCATALASDVTTIGAPIPRCTGDELMLHLILRLAQTMAHDLAVTPINAPAADGDDDWNLLSEVLFQDHDVLMLYDGFTPDEITGMAGVHIDPADWFDEFGVHLPVPDRTPPLSS